MKKYMVLAVILGLLLTGCETKTGTGALAGGAVGAGAGGLIGGGQGALIGGAIGIASGALIGVALDEQDRKIMEKSSPKTVKRMDKGEPLTVGDVIKLSQGGVSDETIIRYIRETRTTYSLSKSHIRRLQHGGVSQRVINYMLDTNA